MVAKMVVPYGSWCSPITSDLIVSETVGLSQVMLNGEDVYWVELRPSEGGRCVVVHTHPGTTDSHGREQAEVVFVTDRAFEPIDKERAKSLGLSVIPVGGAGVMAAGIQREGLGGNPRLEGPVCRSPELGRHLLGIAEVVLADGKHLHLGGRQPEGEKPGKVLHQDPEEPLDGS